MMCLYKKDLLDNIIEILDTNDNTMVKYTYDAWENHTVIDYTEFGLGNINPTDPPVRNKGNLIGANVELKIGIKEG